MENKKDDDSQWMMWVVVIAAILVLFNQFQIYQLSSSIVPTGGLSSGAGKFVRTGGTLDLAEVDINQIQSTAQALAALFPLEEIKTQDDAISMLVPTGIPEYGEAMGISFDDPLKSLADMANAYPSLFQQIKQNPEAFQRYLNLATQPRGVSCEFCCGVGPIGASSNGQSRCGCQHNPAVLSLTMWLLMNTDYSDAEILKEVMYWKTLFFPKNMIGMALQISSGDASVLKDLPGMVGGC